MTADMNLCHFLTYNEIGYIRKQRYKKKHVNPPEQPLKSDCSVVIFNKSILFRTLFPFFCLNDNMLIYNLRGLGQKVSCVCNYRSDPAFR